MGIARLREGVKWICSKCKKEIPQGEGIQINYKPYCEKCAEKIYLKYQSDIFKKGVKIC